MIGGWKLSCVLVPKVSHVNSSSLASSFDKHLSGLLVPLNGLPKVLGTLSNWLMQGRGLSRIASCSPWGSFRLHIVV